MTSSSALAPPIPLSVTQPEPYYTAERINTLLLNWLAVCSAAEGKLSPSYSDALGHTVGSVSDRREWAARKADIEQAIASLGPHSEPWRLVLLRQQGYWLRTIATLIRRRSGDTSAIYWQAIKNMERFLEGKQP